jgi:hypothetical protein
MEKEKVRASELWQLEEGKEHTFLTHRTKKKKRTIEQCD